MDGAAGAVVSVERQGGQRGGAHRGLVVRGVDGDDAELVGEAAAQIGGDIRGDRVSGRDQGQRAVRGRPPDPGTPGTPRSRRCPRNAPHFNDAVAAVIEDTVIGPGCVGADVSAADAAPGVPASRALIATVRTTTRDANGPKRCRAARGARRPASA